MQPILTIALRAAQSAAEKLNYTVTSIASLTAEGTSRKEVFDKAIEDADAAIKLDNKFTRAYIRKAIALYESEGSMELASWTIVAGL